jgi:HSP20 family protein
LDIKLSQEEIDMAIVHWEPYRLFNVPTQPATALRRWLPATDVVEREDSYVLTVDLPGLSESDVKIEVEDKVLTISGERKSQSESTNSGYRRVERAYGSFSRRLTLPEGVDAEAIVANFDKGVLEISIPKPEARKPRRIEISAGTTAPTIEAAA